MIARVPDDDVLEGRKIGARWKRWLDTLRQALNGVRDGTGTPEGVVIAPVGTLYRRLDGGANTTLYVKESGVGNTGWVAK